MALPSTDSILRGDQSKTMLCGKLTFDSGVVIDGVTCSIWFEHIRKDHISHAMFLVAPCEQNPGMPVLFEHQTGPNSIILDSMVWMGGEIRPGTEYNTIHMLPLRITNNRKLVDKDRSTSLTLDLEISNKYAELNWSRDLPGDVNPTSHTIHADQLDVHIWTNENSSRHKNPSHTSSKTGYLKIQIYSQTTADEEIAAKILKTANATMSLIGFFLRYPPGKIKEHRVNWPEKTEGYWSETILSFKEPAFTPTALIMPLTRVSTVVESCLHTALNDDILIQAINVVNESHQIDPKTIARRVFSCLEILKSWYNKKVPYQPDTTFEKIETAINALDRDYIPDSASRRILDMVRPNWSSRPFPMSIRELVQHLNVYWEDLDVPHCNLDGPSLKSLRMRNKLAHGDTEINIKDLNALRTMLERILLRMLGFSEDPNRFWADRRKKPKSK